jgi:hypothetical protein
VSPRGSRSRPPRFLGKMDIAIRRRFTRKWRSSRPDIAGRATRLLLYPSVSSVQGNLPGRCVRGWHYSKGGRCAPSPGGRGKGLGVGSAQGFNAMSLCHNDGVVHDGIVEIALFIPGHTVWLDVPVLIRCPDANRMLPRPGVPVEVPSSPGL